MVIADTGCSTEREDVQLAFCWSHVRRRFYELDARRMALIAARPSSTLRPFAPFSRSFRSRVLASGSVFF
jgi:hypothetical protein